MDVLLSILLQGIRLYSFALFAYILLSWFPGARDSAVGRFLTNICEPFLEPFRRVIPPLGFIDISPIVAFIVLNFATQGLVTLFSMF